MRLLFTTIILTMFAQPLLAATVESLYKNCKPYANNGFELPQDQLGILNALMCRGYITATIENASAVCVGIGLARIYLKNANESELTIMTLDALASDLGSSANSDNFNAATQAFLNFAERNPEKWDLQPTTNLWLANAFPCK